MFAQRLRELRRERGLTQVQLAKKFNLSNGTIGMWETGKREPDFNITKRLAAFFHVSVDYLLGNVNDPSFYLDNERTLREINSYENPEEDGNSEIAFNDFAYAMQDESKNLTDEDKQLLLSMAKQLNHARERKDGKSE